MTSERLSNYLIRKGVLSPKMLQQLQTEILSGQPFDFEKIPGKKTAQTRKDKIETIQKVKPKFNPKKKNRRK